jgi:hypothetical protein
MVKAVMAFLGHVFGSISEAERKGSHQSYSEVAHLLIPAFSSHFISEPWPRHPYHTFLQQHGASLKKASSYIFSISGPSSPALLDRQNTSCDVLSALPQNSLVCDLGQSLANGLD